MVKVENKGKLGRERKWHIRSVLTQADAFPQDLPSFNIKGQTNMKTFPGGILTAIILIVMLFYSLDKFISLMQKENPYV